MKRPGVRAEVWISLYTASYAEALARMDEARVEAGRRFRGEPATQNGAIYSRSARPGWPSDQSRPLLTRELAIPLAQRFFATVLADLDLEGPVDPDHIFDFKRELEDRHARLTQPGEEDEVFGEQVWVLNEAGLRADYLDTPCVALRGYLQRALAQLTLFRLARLEGDFRDQIADALFSGARASPPLPADGSPSTAATSLEAVILEDWAKERAVSPKGIDKHRAVVRWFIERGGPTHVEAITRKDVLAFKRRMIDDGVTPANANAKLSCLRTLLGYAVENNYVAVNPAAGVVVQDKDKDRRKRKEFTLAALQAIYSSPVYLEGQRPIQGRGEAAYWIPLIALFTGARLEEIAQLRPKDVRLETYADQDGKQQSAWIIEIAETDETSTKNAASERVVPVHCELERLGFLLFAKDTNDAGHHRLFHELRPNKYGRLGAKWGEWWSRYRREVCGVVDPRMVFHSYRHTFKQNARHVGMIEGVQRQIMGHSPGDTADSYGASRYSLHQLVEGMRLYRIAGLALPKRGGTSDKYSEQTL